MKEIKVPRGTNLFDYVTDPARQAAVVTTNGMLKRDGCAVMGAGIARYTRDHFPGIDKKLGELLACRGNHVTDLGLWRDMRTGKQVHIITMPTKTNWREPSKLWLIERSALELNGLSMIGGPEEVFLPMPGCSNGGLNYMSQVRPILQRILDDRFTVLVEDR